MDVIPCGAHMALVVFLRGVNVGGAKAFKPSALARDLRAHDVSNLGAAGTYVVGGRIAPEELRREILDRLPFEAEILVCPASEIVDLVDADSFGDKPLSKDVRKFVSVLVAEPGRAPKLPLAEPPGDDWQVKVVHRKNRYVLSLWRRRGLRFRYPNEVVERAYAVAATTRNWNTMRKVRERLREKR